MANQKTEGISDENNIPFNPQNYNNIRVGWCLLNHTHKNITSGL